MTDFMPDLEWDPGAVKANREKLDAARARINAAIGALDALCRSNYSLCPHARQVNRYESGDYGGGGGGYIGTECLDCGSTRLPFKY